MIMMLQLYKEIRIKYLDFIFLKVKVYFFYNLTIWCQTQNMKKLYIIWNYPNTNLWISSMNKITIRSLYYFFFLMIFGRENELIKFLRHLFMNDVLFSDICQHFYMCFFCWFHLLCVALGAIFWPVFISFNQ